MTVLVLNGCHVVTMNAGRDEHPRGYVAIDGNRIAGAGPHEAALRELAAKLPNVFFEGLLGGASLARLFRGARAVVVPSLFPETFGYVVLESFAVGTPVVVHEEGGALQETGVLSGGGLGYRNDGELLLALRRMVHDEELRAELAARGFAQRIREWSETEHIHNYFELIGRYREARGVRPVYRPHRAGTAVAEPRPPLAGVRRPQD